MLLCVHVKTLETTSERAVHGSVVVCTALVVHTTARSLECKALDRGLLMAISRDV